LKEFSGATKSGAQTGWTAGGGVEWALWNNWSLKTEYLYLSLGNFPNLAAQQQSTCSVLPDYFLASQTS
jgi:opacity protein-like surface antigen